MKDDQRAERWLKRAAEIRAEALAVSHREVRAALLKLAAEWEHMGAKARARAESEVRSPGQPTSTPGWSEIPSDRDTTRRH